MKNIFEQHALRKCLLLLLWLFVASLSKMAYAQGYYSITSEGWHSDGADIELAHIGGSSMRPELVMLSYDDPSTANSLRYRIAWDVDANGAPSSWSNTKQIDGFGWEGQGAGVAITNLDRHLRPDMLLMAVDSGGNHNNHERQIRYRMAWNLNSAGEPASVGPVFTTSTGFEEDDARNIIGAAATFARLDADPRVDLVMALLVDHKEIRMTGNYPHHPVPKFDINLVIGLNMKSDGRPERWKKIPVYLYHRAFLPIAPFDGIGIAATDLNNDGNQELIYMLNSEKDPNAGIFGYNGFHYYIDYGLSQNIKRGYFMTAYNVQPNGLDVPGTGFQALGAGLAAADLDFDGAEELIFMALEKKQYDNEFRYRLHHPE